MDDIAILANNLEYLQNMLDIIVEVCLQFELRITIAKTKMMIFSI